MLLVCPPIVSVLMKPIIFAGHPVRRDSSGFTRKTLQRSPPYLDHHSNPSSSRTQSKATPTNPGTDSAYTECSQSPILSMCEPASFLLPNLPRTKILTDCYMTPNSQSYVFATRAALQHTSTVVSSFGIAHPSALVSSVRISPTLPTSHKSLQQLINRISFSRTVTTRHPPLHATLILDRISSHLSSPVELLLFQREGEMNGLPCERLFSMP